MPLTGMQARAWVAAFRSVMAFTHNLPPATFSGGEQQRVNIVHEAIADKIVDVAAFAPGRAAA